MEAAGIVPPAQAGPYYDIGGLAFDELKIQRGTIYQGDIIVGFVQESDADALLVRAACDHVLAAETHVTVLLEPRARRQT